MGGPRPGLPPVTPRAPGHPQGTHSHQRAHCLSRVGREKDERQGEGKGTAKREEKKGRKMEKERRSREGKKKGGKKVETGRPRRGPAARLPEGVHRMVPCMGPVRAWTKGFAFALHREKISVSRARAFW